MTPPLTSARQPDHEGPARTPRAGPSPSPHSRSQRDAKLLILDDVQHVAGRPHPANGVERTGNGAGDSQRGNGKRPGHRRTSFKPVAGHPTATRPSRKVSSTGFDGDHQAWRNIDGGTEEVPGGTAGAVDPDDVGRPSEPGVASQRVPADR